MGDEGLYFSVNQDTFLAEEPGTLSTTGGEVVHSSHFNFILPCTLCRVVTLDLRRFAK